MADVTISDLNLGTPLGSHFIPYSTGVGGNGASGVVIIRYTI